MYMLHCTLHYGNVTATLLCLLERGAMILVRRGKGIRVEWQKSPRRYKSHQHKWPITMRESMRFAPLLIGVSRRGGSLRLILSDSDPPARGLLSSLFPRRVCTPDRSAIHRLLIRNGNSTIELWPGGLSIQPPRRRTIDDIKMNCRAASNGGYMAAQQVYLRNC